MSPGINVLTIHPRYWSFYCFVLDEFWASELPRSRAVFKDFYRRREALFSMACHVCDAKEHATLVGNIVGSKRVAPLAQEESFDPTFDYIKEPLGGYGLYYRSAMEATGTLVVATPANGFVFDAPTPAGRALAAAYRDAISSTTLWRDHLGGTLDEPVPRRVLVEFARRGCLCQLRTAKAHDLPLLQDLFTHAGQHPEARRQTLRLLLDLSRVAQEDGIAESRFRELIYFRQLHDETYHPRRDLVDVARRWRLYQAREYFAFVFNRLLGWVVRQGAHETDDGLVALPLTRIWEMVDEALDEQDFTSQTGLSKAPVRSSTPASRFADLLASQVDLEPGVDEVWPPHGTLDEQVLFQWASDPTDDAETLAALLALMLLIYRRVGTPGRIADLGDDASLLSEGGSLRVGMAVFFGQLTKRLMAGDTLSDLARWMIHDFVIVQHERVATAKLPDDTFRLRRVGDSVRFFPHQEAGAVLNNSRYVALSTTAHELGLVSSLREPQRRLTPTGRRLLQHGDLPAGALDSAAEPYAQVLEH
ncbi:hypothetical protein [Rhodococcus ruber]|uniref:hypothetical protein n=1 Tax=Rhodococcus ruber TaxID=1830 RepID=UPI00190F64BF|nr:hypothetical protein [Rhodococcus ruber]